MVAIGDILLGAFGMQVHEALYRGVLCRRAIDISPLTRVQNNSMQCVSCVLMKTGMRMTLETIG